MKLTSGPAYDEIRKSHSNEVVPVVVAEWNNNRYYRAYADNTPTEQSEGFDIEIFPIESIVGYDRPTAGIAKACVGQSRVAPARHTGVPSTRFYTVSKDDAYKYWQSPWASGATGDIAGCSPHIEYCQEAIDASNASEPRVGITVKANRVKVVFETAYAKPVNFTIQIKTSVAGSWTTIATNPTIGSNGVVEVYRTETTWSTVKPAILGTVDIHSVRVNVTKMNTPYAHCNVIEMTTLLELDMTADVVSMSDTFSIGEDDMLTPIGTLSSNTGSVTLFNENGLYKNLNVSSILYNLLDKNVKITGGYVYTKSNTWVQQFVMYSDTWKENDYETTVTLVDGSRRLQEMTAPRVLYQNLPVSEIVWRLCDAVGFNDYTVEAQNDTTIDIFWTEEGQTVWEAFQGLSKGTQCAMYFDAFGKLRMRSREFAFNPNAPVSWIAREEQLGDEVPDIIDIENNAAYESNVVKINYQKTHFSEPVGSIVPLEAVWEPEDTLVLRATPLLKSMTNNNSYPWIIIKPEEARVWPYSGMANIEGEYIRYEGKEYRYYDNKTVSWTTCKSLEEQKLLDAKSHATKVHLNGYSGALRVVERGVWNSDPAAHKIDIEDWRAQTVDWASGNGIEVTNKQNNGVKHNKMSSSVTLTQGKTKKYTDSLLFLRGNTTNEGWRRLGARIKFKDGHGLSRGGIFFNSDSSLGGYFVDIITTAKMDASTRKLRNEVIFYSRKKNGDSKRFGGDVVKVTNASSKSSAGSKTSATMGDEFAILADRWYDIDVRFQPSTHLVQIWINGQHSISTTIPAGEWRHNWVSRFGVFVTGDSSIEVEYVYGINRDDEGYATQDLFWDRIEGGFYGNQILKDYVFEVRKSNKKKKSSEAEKIRYRQRLFDEFGPIVHEVREFDINFTADDNLPVLHSKLFSSNAAQTAVLEYSGGITGAKFIVANTSRNNAVLSGEDNLSTLGVSAINRNFFVYGRPVKQQDSKSIERRDEWAVRRRGVIETEYESKWIQNEAAAVALGDWLIKNWARSDAALDVEIFGNPLIEIGDIIKLQAGDISPDARWFVLEVSTDFSEGLTTNLRLRKVGV